MSAISPPDDFADKLDSDLAHRTFQGTWGHPATLILLFFTTTLPADSPKAFWVAVAAMTAVVLFRIPLLIFSKKSPRFQLKHWRSAVMLNTFLAAIVWGMLNAYVCASYGCQSRNSTLMVLYISAIAGAGVHLLVQSVPLVGIYLAALLGPLALTSSFQGAQGLWLAAAIVFYSIYLMSQARRLHHEYWQQLRVNRQLSIRAHRDSLTGLANRLAFQESLTRSVSSARKNNASVALLYIDLDGFKQINDRLSHRAGDLFLCEIASRLASCCMDGNESFRLGGDEFTVLLKEATTPEAALLLARRLQEKFQEPMTIDGIRLTASASIGLSLFPDDCSNEEDLLRAADHAMYAAKAAGKGNHRVFHDDRQSPRFADNDFAREIRTAIGSNQFDVHYQPQVNSRGELAGLEALLRWTHPTLGNIPPLDFIPLAEETGLIVPLGFWVLRQVCEQGVIWHQQGYAPVPIAVNVSPVQFGNPDFVGTLMTILQETGFRPSLLTLEITESTLLGKQDSAPAQLLQIRDLGIKIAVDDFGTGYSSLSRIDSLPIDVIKLDRTFVSAIQNSGDRAPIVEAILAMARGLNLDVIAEGIEVPAQYEVLSRLGCEVFQGYYFGKASKAEFARHFQSNQRGAEVSLEPVALNVA